ncbi:PorT family protein [Chryseobacterium sp. Tr-659]|uniref:outer membrane beta-barrel protein n=1 Tax=Chryseobacterium sp. Tr-659 TaxID=2608340 RepID=UPI001423D41B|nr:outer membrane beta-barrel protein [Chryseobacterium sp. Tr-659]NIF06254.1 PorT family protein [Chryseobacterium sp. Tr-659]
MKKKLCRAVSLFLLSAGTYISAQHQFNVTLDAGYTNSILHSNLSNLIESKYKSRPGYGINLSGEYMVWKSFFVSAGAGFQQKNYRFERTGQYAGWYTNYTNNFIVLPIQAGSYILNNPHKDKGLWFKVSGGIYSEYWLSMKREGRYPLVGGLQESPPNTHASVSERYDFKTNENQLDRWGYGLTGTLQAGYSFKKLSVHASYNYQHGLSDINSYNENKQQKSSIRSYMISAGITYTIN